MNVSLLKKQATKRQVRQLKSQHVAGGVQWYKWALIPSLNPSTPSSNAVLAVFTKKDPKAAQPLLIKTANIQSSSRFEIDTGQPLDPLKPHSSNQQPQEQRTGPRQQDVAMLKVISKYFRLNIQF